MRLAHRNIWNQLNVYGYPMTDLTHVISGLYGVHVGLTATPV